MKCAFYYYEKKYRGQRISSTINSSTYLLISAVKSMSLDVICGCCRWPLTLMCFPLTVTLICWRTPRWNTVYSPYTQQYNSLFTSTDWPDTCIDTALEIRATVIPIFTHNSTVLTTVGEIIDAKHNNTLLHPYCSKLYVVKPCQRFVEIHYENHRPYTIVL